MFSSSSSTIKGVISRSLQFVKSFDKLGLSFTVADVMTDEHNSNNRITNCASSDGDDRDDC